MKGLIHFHSNYSHDAVLSLEQIRQLAIRKKIDFICMSDHVEDIKDYKKYVSHCKKLSDNKFKFFPGFEFYIGKNHFVLLNTDKKIKLIKEIKTDNVFLLSHPDTVRIPTPIIEKLDGVEIWNISDDSRFVPNKRKIRVYRKLKRINSFLKAFTAIDFHQNYDFKSTYIITKTNNVIRDFKNGNFYTLDQRIKISSSGKMKFKTSFYFFNIFYQFMRLIGKINQVLKLKVPYKIRKMFYKLY